MAGILALSYRITVAHVSEGPAGTATRNYVAEDREGRNWFVKSYPAGTELAKERQALALGESAGLGGVLVPAERQTVTGDVIASAGGLSVSVAEYVEGTSEGAHTAEGGLIGERWAAAGEAVGRLHRILARHPAGRHALSRPVRCATSNGPAGGWRSCSPGGPPRAAAP
ncbi:phosphotransferase [Streptomyces decoyicus]|uniref:phosphotransferase n=1 Tax=Streptomyces decoyicus TaxID=249567 RepID=UPI00363AEC88